jgi:hypothetical protein
MDLDDDTVDGEASGADGEGDVVDDLPSSAADPVVAEPVVTDADVVNGPTRETDAPTDR